MSLQAHGREAVVNRIDAEAYMNEPQKASGSGRGPSKGHGAKPARIRDQALVALVAGKGPADAAASVGIGVRTLSRWLNDPSFVADLHKARTEAFDVAMARVMAGANTAAHTLIELLNPEHPPAIRLGAARSLLDLGIERHDAATVVARLVELERQVMAQGARSWAR